ncbi:MAG: class I SAM-dependent methyltransferase [Lachnospiraceae bacterium]|nr:class I SAM-dependent methyltransferase [Lachnospiraceae bacterium]
MDSNDYYNQYASIYFENTVDLDVSHLMEPFISYLDEGSSVLDLGCGSGRDSLTFLNMGYDVTALDGSEEMCSLASIHTDLDVLHMQFEDLDFEEVFDGIWACASLVHIEKEELPSIIQKISKALNPGGVFYMSVHKGDFEGIRHQRYFSEYKEEELQKVLRKFPELKIQDIWTTDDVRQKSDGQEWLNLLIQKEF